MSDLIDRQAAIDALRQLQKNISGDYTELDPMVMAGCGYIGDCIGELECLPSAQPEISCSETPNTSDTISRQAAIEALKHDEEYDEDIPNRADGVRDAIITISSLPSAQPEIKPIDYQDCANAMLRMWMDEVVTDGEYNRIMDKLNAFWRTRNERSDR